MDPQPPIPLIPPGSSSRPLNPPVLPELHDAPPQSPQGKPIISEAQANFHVHVEGMKAQEEARKTGTDPEAAKVLLNAVAGGIVIGPHTFPPITAGFILLLPMLTKACEQSATLNHESGQMMAMAYALVGPERCWKTLRSPDLAVKFDELVWEFAKDFTLEQLKELAAWIGTELQRMNGEAEEQNVGKP